MIHGYSAISINLVSTHAVCLVHTIGQKNTLSQATSEGGGVGQFLFILNNKYKSSLKTILLHVLFSCPTYFFFFSSNYINICHRKVLCPRLLFTIALAQVSDVRAYSQKIVLIHHMNETCKFKDLLVQAYFDKNFKGFKIQTIYDFIPSPQLIPLILLQLR